jgi:hypothetical protein
MPALAADVVNAGQNQEEPGSGVSPANTALAYGMMLMPSTTACNNFNQAVLWQGPTSDGATAWYGGWGPFAANTGLYRSEHVRFSQEQNTGPGHHAGANQYSLKIGGTQPYAAGIGSPLVAVTPGTTVTVSVKYLIWDHDNGGMDYDWASLGVKPDALDSPAIYVNGYTRGRWSELTQSVQAGPSGEIMVLVQASSPAAINSNIYFDDIEIVIDGHHLTDCVTEHADGS